MSPQPLQLVQPASNIYHICLAILAWSTYRQRCTYNCVLQTLCTIAISRQLFHRQYGCFGSARTDLRFPQTNSGDVSRLGNVATSWDIWGYIMQNDAFRRRSFCSCFHAKYGFHCGGKMVEYCLPNETSLDFAAVNTQIYRFYLDIRCALLFLLLFCL